MSGSGPVRIAVAGAAGRMGRAVLSSAIDDHAVAVTGALVRRAHSWEGRDLGVCLGRAAMGVTVTQDPALAFAAAQVVIDFTHPASTLSFLPLLKESGRALVSGTTGFTPEQWQELEQAAADLPIVWGANMSLGVNILLALVEQSRRMLGPGYDLEVLELHHRNKKDAPSGTALALARAALAPGEEALAEALVLRQQGFIGARRPGEIGVGVLRGGGVVGEHTALFLGDHERLELTHRASDRGAFAVGALRAAIWVTAHPPALYDMRDVLGLGMAPAAT